VVDTSAARAKGKGFAEFGSWEIVLPRRRTRQQLVTRARAHLKARRARI